jgi:hypothetical protein
MGAGLANIVTTQNGVNQLLEQHSDSPPEGFGQGSARMQSVLEEHARGIGHGKVEVLWKAPPIE